jgi:hypothetical protein
MGHMRLILLFLAPFARRTLYKPQLEWSLRRQCPAVRVTSLFWKKMAHVSNWTRCVTSQRTVIFFIAVMTFSNLHSICIIQIYQEMSSFQGLYSSESGKATSLYVRMPCNRVTGGIERINENFHFFLESGSLSVWSSSQSFWLLTQRSRVRFLALPNFLSSSGSGTGSTQPLWE